MYISKKIIVFVTVIGLVFGNTMTTPQAHAVFGVGDTTIDLPNLLKEFGIDTIVTILQTRILDKLVDDALNWANGGFDGEPGFLDNWDGFLEGVGEDVYTNAISYAGSAASGAYSNSSAGTTANSAEYNNCRDQAEAGLGSDPTQAEINAAYAPCENLNPSASTQAESNYATYLSGDLDGSRDVVGVVTDFAIKQLSSDFQLDSLLSGEGETLTTLLGSKETVDSFKSGDFSAGGWAGYVALGDPHNTDAGLESVVQGELEAKERKETEQKLADLATPQKYLNKTKCEEYKKDPEGNDTQECIREITQTPGDQVAEKVNNGLNKEEDRSSLAKELSDVLASAVGKLVNGLLQTGLNALSGAISDQGGSALAENDEFENVFQNEYDILGINSNPVKPEFTGPISIDPATEDANIVDLNSTAIQNDNSIPDISELEAILNLEYAFDQAYIQTNNFLDGKQEVIEEMRKAQPELIYLDRCIPGPDFGWEKRYTDLIDTEGNGYGGKYENADKDGDPDDGDEGGTEAKYTSPGINAQANKLGFNLLKSMAKDRQINIPGAIEMIALTHAYLKIGNDGIASARTSMEDKKEAMIIISQLRGTIREDYKNFRNVLRDSDELNSNTAWDNFPIFESEWDKLSREETIQILEMEVKNSNAVTLGSSALTSLSQENIGYLLEQGAGDTAMILKTVAQGGPTTPTEFLDRDPEKAKNVVLAYAWEEIWKEGMLDKPADLNADKLSGKEQRENILRYFFSIKNKLATAQDVINVELEFLTVVDNNLKISNYLNDCRQFRQFMYGNGTWWDIPKVQTSSYTGTAGNSEGEGSDGYTTTEQIIAGILSGGASILFNEIEEEVQDDIQSQDDTLATLYAKDIGIWIGNVPYKSREQIVAFLESEREKQNDENDLNTSVFRTDIITSPSRIETSILSAEVDINDYYIRNYGPKPTATLEGHPLKYLDNNDDTYYGDTAYRVDILLSRDYVLAEGGSGARKIRGQTGVLFCWTQGDYSLHSKGNAKEAEEVVSECLKPWYYTKDIEYKIIFSDIQ